MKLKGLLARLLFVLPVMLLGCGISTPTATRTATEAVTPSATEIVTPSTTDVSGVTITNHPRPELAVDFGPFEDAGCPANEYGLRYCEPDGPLAALGCDRIREPSDLLGGLEPSLPLAVCLVEPLNHPDEPGLMDQIEAEGSYLYRTGGLMPVYVRYVVSRDDQFQLIKTEGEFRDAFAPIETADEALSYGLAVRNLSAYYGLEANPDYEYFVGALEDTHVETVADGYLVHLFYYQAFGCGPHNTHAVVLRITNQGAIEEASSEPVYKNPSEDDLCVD